MAVIDDKQAHYEVIDSAAKAATVCQEMFGQKVSAWVVGVRDPKSIGRWARGDDNLQKHERESRLLNLAAVAQVLSHRLADDPNRARTWLLSPNPALADTAAAQWIHDDKPVSAVLAAARAYVR